MEHLVIITPNGGLFAQKLNLSCRFKKISVSSTYAIFAYVGIFPPKQKVVDILSCYDFKEFSLDKETNYYRLKVYAE